jgi:hypothetical protein
MKKDAPPIAFFNSRRLRDYPRLMLGTMVFILILNILLRHGWMGAVKQIIGGDFIMLYSAGQLYQKDIDSLYDFQKQGEIQRELLAPTPFDGIMPFNYPPYVAQAISILALLPLPEALALWSIFIISCVTVSVYWISKYLVPTWLYDRGLTFFQLLVITCSFFAFIEGLLVGQNHGLTLLLLTGMVVWSLKEKWFLAGLIAGLTVYKPQFAIGFLIIWFVWGKYEALAGYAITSILWIGWFILNNGVSLFQTYLSIIPILMRMPYLEGFGGYLEVTTYGLLISVIPPKAWSGIMFFTQTLAVLLSLGLAWAAFQQRHKPMNQRQPALILAILFPLVIAPHTLLHDLVILIPAMILWADQAPSSRLLYACIAIYLGAFILPLITHATGIALFALIPLGLLVAQVRQIILDRKYR